MSGALSALTHFLAAVLTAIGALCFGLTVVSAALLALSAALNVIRFLWALKRSDARGERK